MMNMYVALCYTTVSLTEVEAAYHACHSVSVKALSACCRIPFVCVDGHILCRALFQRTWIDLFG